MRITQLRIAGKKIDAVLVAGGPGFKIYTASGIDGFIISAAKKLLVVSEDSPDFKIVGRYVNLRFQPIAERSKVKSHFEAFLSTAAEPQPPVTEPPPDLQQ